MTGLAWTALFLGLGIAALGFVLPDRFSGWRGGLLSFLAPIGLALSLLGVLLICVPGFFESPPGASSTQSTPPSTGETP